MHGDRSDFLWVNDLARHTPWLHPLVSGYARYGVVGFALLLLAGVVVARHDDERLTRALVAGGGVLLAVALNQPIVHAVNEQRPFRALPHVLLLVHASTDGSFPSDHATMSGAVAVGLLWVDRRLGAVAAVAGVLMAASRVYVGAHYPVDVLAGLVLGGLVAAALQVWVSRPVTRVVAAAVRRLPALRRAQPTAH